MSDTNNSLSTPLPDTNTDSSPLVSEVQTPLVGGSGIDFSSENSKKQSLERSKWEDITEEEKEQIRKLFSVIDADGNGDLSSDELSQVLSAKIKDPNKLAEMTKGLMDDIDKTGSGGINFDNFRDAIAEWWFVKN